MEKNSEQRALTQTEIDAIKAQRQTATPATDNGAGQPATERQPLYTVEITTEVDGVDRIHVDYYDQTATDIRTMVERVLSYGWTQATICLYSTELEIISKCKTFKASNGGREKIFELIDKTIATPRRGRKRGERRTTVVR